MIQPVYIFRVNIIDLGSIYDHVQPDPSAESVFTQLRNATVLVDGVDRPLKQGDVFSLFGETAIRVKNLYIGKLPQVLELIEIPNVTNLSLSNEELDVTIEWEPNNDYYTSVEYYTDMWNEIVIDKGVGEVLITATEESIFEVRVKFTDGLGNYSSIYTSSEIDLTPEESDGDIVFIQSKTSGQSPSDAARSCVLDDNPSVNDYIVAAIAVINQEEDPDPILTVQNNVGASYALIESATFIKNSQQITLKMFAKKVTSAIDDATIVVTPDRSCTSVISALVFSGVNTTSPLDDAASAESNIGADTMTAGPINITTNGGLAIGAFCGAASVDTVTINEDYILEVNHGDGGLDLTDIMLYVSYKLNVDAGTEEPFATWDGGADAYGVISASFNN